MKKKRVIKMITPMASVIALGVGAYFGMENVTEVENALVAIGTGVVTILGAFGIWANNDKSND